MRYTVFLLIFYQYKYLSLLKIGTVYSTGTRTETQPTRTSKKTQVKKGTSSDL